MNDKRFTLRLVAIGVCMAIYVTYLFQLAATSARDPLDLLRHVPVNAAWATLIFVATLACALVASRAERGGGP
jgi:hypothetical protein